MYIRKRVICEWCRSNYKNMSSWTNFSVEENFFYNSLLIRERSHLSHAECVICMQRNGYSFTVFLGEPDFYWFDWLKIATDFESQVPRRKGMDFYRTSNSPSWGAAVEGVVCRGWNDRYRCLENVCSYKWGSGNANNFRSFDGLHIFPSLDCHQPPFGWITNDCLGTAFIVLHRRWRHEAAIATRRDLLELVYSILCLILMGVNDG
jgi:hypothetical protein